MTKDTHTPIRREFRERIGTALAALEVETEAESSVDLFRVLINAVRESGRLDHAWLLWTVLVGTLPREQELRSLHRILRRMADPDEAARRTLAMTREVARRRGSWGRPVRIVTDATVLDVDFCARYEHNTGIQRLVRETVARWSRDGHDLVLAAWTPGGRMLRDVDSVERDRVVRWSDPDRDHSAHAADGPTPLIVPWRCRIVLMEVPNLDACESLGTLAEHSGNRVDAIGYDAIPLVSADTVPGLERERFGRYLSVIKHAERVIGISDAAADEFRGFARAVRTQGLPGPTCLAVPLPVDFPHRPHDEAHDESPLFVCVGSHEPRKNHYNVLWAAQRLWAEGLEFRLVFAGRGSANLVAKFDRIVARLQREGRQVEARRQASDAELAGLYAAATATVFPSLHEGYGLPVAESLAAGSPVITTRYGSTAEIAHGGGCVLVDPRDVGSIADAMRRVISSPGFVDGLRGELAARRDRTWDDYADELWTALTGAER